MTSRPSTAAPILAALAIVLLPLGTYVGRYFWLGEQTDWPIENSRVVVRDFPYAWLSEGFKPAGKIEKWLRNEPVLIMSSRSPPLPSPSEQSLREEMMGRKWLLKAVSHISRS